MQGRVNEPPSARRARHIRSMNIARVAIVLLSTSIAYAQPAPNTDEKSPETAVGLSLATTASGVGVLALAYELRSTDSTTALVTFGVALTVIGPTVGHAYAGQAWNAGLGLRLASVATGVIGGALLVNCLDECRDHSKADVGAALFLTSAIVYAGATLYEIGTAGAAADRYNRMHVGAAPLPGGGAIVLGGRF